MTDKSRTKHLNSYLFKYKEMRKLVLIIIAAINCCGYLSCNSVAVDKTASPASSVPSLDESWAKSFLDSSNRKFSDQFAAGDSAAVASNYWPDAELLVDNTEVIKGNDIVRAWGGTIRMGMKQLSLATTDITGSPTFIIETGNYEIKDGNNSIADRGKYIVVWENRDGVWKIYRDIGSTSMPASK